MLQRHILALAAARLAVRRPPVGPAVSAARAAPGAPRGRAVQLAAGAEAGVRSRLPRRRRRRHHLLGGGVLVVLDGVRRADPRARTRGLHDGTQCFVLVFFNMRNLDIRFITNREFLAVPICRLNN